MTLAVWGVQNALERAAQSEVNPKRCGWLQNPAVWGVPTSSEQGVDHRWPTSGGGGLGVAT